MTRARAPIATLALAGALAAAATLPGRAGLTALYVLIAVLPGVGLAGTLRPRTTPVATWVLGLAIGPLAAGLAGWGLLGLGVPIRAAALAVGAAGVALMVLASLVRPADAAARADAAELALPGPLALGAVLAVMVLTPPLFNPWISMRGDAWTHAGIVWQIVERGVPAMEPRFAGISCHYVWILHVALALLSAVRGDAPFWSMSLLNAAVLLPTICFGGALAFQVWGTRRAANAGAFLLATGMNAGAHLLRPLELARAFVGSVRGWPAVRQLLSEHHPGTALVVYDLGAPFARMVNFLDKYLIGTALGYGYLLMMLVLWGALRGLGGRRDGWAWAAAGAAGTMFVHGVVGLSVIPVACGAAAAALVLGAFRAGFPPRARLVALGLAVGGGGLLALPYFYRVASGWSPEQSGLHQSYFGFDAITVWTLATALGIVLAFALPGSLAKWRARDAVATWLVLDLAGMLAFALVVRLPEENQIKFVFEALVPAAALAAVPFADWLTRFRGERPRLAAATILIVFVLPPLLTWQGFQWDPEGRTVRALHPHPGDRDLYAWLRDRTERDAVLVDAGYNDALMVEARRRLYLGTSFGPERGAFPLDQVRERRAVVADLYAHADSLDAALRSFATQDGPVYAVFRGDATPDTSGAPWRRLDARPDRCALVYDRDGNRVYRIANAPTSTQERTR